jgi:RNA polymerase sigma-70 factor (ECF subfamily)
LKSSIVLPLIMDLQEFKTQVFPLRNRLYRLSKRLLEDADEAQDTVQDVFVKLWNMREKLDRYRNVEALAVVMTRNMSLDKLKTRKYKTEKLEDMKSEVEGILFEEKKDLSDVVKRIRVIIGTLPELQKTVIQLRDIEGYDFEEIAVMMDMKENAVRVTLSRARKKIREILINSKIYEFQKN